MTADADLATALDALDRATDTPSLVIAAQTVVQLHNPKAAPSLIKTLGYNNPAVAAVATKGLISLGNNIVPQLLESLDTNNYGARAWIVKILATLRDPRGLAVLLKAIHVDIAPSVRRSATRGLAELDLKNTEQNDDLAQCFAGLLHAGHDDEWVVRYAAAYGLEQRLPDPSLTPQQHREGLMLLQGLASAQESVTVVRMRASQALDRLSSA